MNLDIFPSQGAKAVRSGVYGEAKLLAAFAAFKIKAIDDQPSYHDSQLWPRKGKLLLRQSKQVTGRFVDYLYKDYDRHLSVAMECKNQEGWGTTDEKLSYTIDMLIVAEHPFWLILSGNGWNPTVIKFMEAKIKAAAIERPSRLIWDHFLYRAVERLVERGEIA
jgi:hypothetical protein